MGNSQVGQVGSVGSGSGSGSVSVSVSGTILVGRNTAGHKAWLEGHGYSVSQDGSVLTVSGSGFVSELDCSIDPVKVLREQVVGRKLLLTYSSKVSVVSKDGTVRVLRSIPLCTVLGPASALVVKPIGVEEVKKVNPFGAL